MLCVERLVQTTLRSVIGDMGLDDTLASRAEIEKLVTNKISKICQDWGLAIKGVDLLEIEPTASILVCASSSALSFRMPCISRSRLRDTEERKRSLRKVLLSRLVSLVRSPSSCELCSGGFLPGHEGQRHWWGRVPEAHQQGYCGCPLHCCRAESRSHSSHCWCSQGMLLCFVSSLGNHQGCHSVPYWCPVYPGPAVHRHKERLVRPLHASSGMDSDSTPLLCLDGHLWCCWKTQLISVLVLFLLFYFFISCSFYSLLSLLFLICILVWFFINSWWLCFFIHEKDVQ